MLGTIACAFGGGFFVSLYDLKSQDALGRERLVRFGSYQQVDEQRAYPECRKNVLNAGRTCQT